MLHVKPHSHPGILQRTGVLIFHWGSESGWEQWAGTVLGEGHVPATLQLATTAIGTYSCQWVTLVTFQELHTEHNIPSLVPSD